MSTRCNLIIKDDIDAIQLYRQDGYPDGKYGVLAELEQVQRFTDPDSFEAVEYSAAVVAAWKGEGWGTMYIDGTAKGWTKIHDDVEWVYVIEQTRGMSEPQVSVYDWSAHWLGKSDLATVEPVPVLTCALSEAHQAGLNWDVDE